MIGLKANISDTTNITKLQDMLASHKTNTAIVEEVYNSVMRQFDTEGQGKWKPLSKRYLKQRKKEKYPYGSHFPLLQRSRLLKKSIQTSTTPLGGIVYTNLYYAKYANSDREFMTVDDYAKENIRELLIKQLK